MKLKEMTLRVPEEHINEVKEMLLGYIEEHIKSEHRKVAYMSVEEQVNEEIRLFREANNIAEGK